MVIFNLNFIEVDAYVIKGAVSRGWIGVLFEWLLDRLCLGVLFEWLLDRLCLGVLFE
jgi:hypothetical protein